MLFAKRIFNELRITLTTEYFGNYFAKLSHSALGLLIVLLLVPSVLSGLVLASRLYVHAL